MSRTLNNSIAARAAAHSRAKAGTAAPATATGCRCSCHRGEVVLICLDFLRPDGHVCERDPAAAAPPTLTQADVFTGLDETPGAT